MKNIILTALVAIGLVASSFTTKTYDQTLPKISLKNSEGETVDISSYGTNGKITAISFWATWCGPCIKELDAINEVYEDWQEDYNFELIAVTIDNSRSSSKVKPLVAGKGWEYEILMDENKQLALAMNVSNPPYLVLVDESGKIVYTHSGYKPGDEVELEEELEKLHKASEEHEEEKEVKEEVAE